MKIIYPSRTQKTSSQVGSHRQARRILSSGSAFASSFSVRGGCPWQIMLFVLGFW